jgi:hypothetical protein
MWFMVVLVLLAVFLLLTAYSMPKKHKVYASFTTIPTRIKYIEPALKSLRNQTIKLDGIILNVPMKYKRFDTKLVVPEFVKKYNVIVNHVTEDFGPATKILGALTCPTVKRNDVILVTDDDLEKSHWWAKNLLNRVNKDDKKIHSFVEKRLGNGVIWGYMGYAFRKRLLNYEDLLKFYRSLESECFLVDDHMLTAYMHHKKIQVINSSLKEPVNKVLDLKDSLSNDNGYDSRYRVSTRCRNLAKRVHGVEFPFWCCRHCCKRGKPRTD